LELIRNITAIILRTRVMVEATRNLIHNTLRMRAAVGAIRKIIRKIIRNLIRNTVRMRAVAGRTPNITTIPCTL